MFKKLLSLGALLALLSSCSSSHRQIERFATCPDSPNCVSSKANPSSRAYIEPIYYTKKLSEEEVADRIISINESINRSKLITRDGSYLHFEFRTFLGFVDDVEYDINTEQQIIHFRSASRLGYYDFGKNLSRYNEIKNHIVS